MSLAQRLREARKAAGLTLEQLASASDVSKTYLWELENDEERKIKPSAEVLLKIAGPLLTTIADLLGQPVVQVNQTKVDISKSLVEFREFMERIGEPISEEEFRDLATMRFRGGQPRTKDDWHDLYRTLKRTTRR
ncbi:MAG: helix-turn-helix domain-containing protein [Pirellulaceae bacterium]